MNGSHSEWKLNRCSKCNVINYYFFALFILFCPILLVYTHTYTHTYTYTHTHTFTHTHTYTYTSTYTYTHTSIYTYTHT